MLRRGIARSFSNKRSSSNESTQALLNSYSQIRPKLITFPDLIQYGAPPLSPETLIKSAEATRVLLLGGLARRVSDHSSLPFLPATNPSLRAVSSLYEDAFHSLTLVPEIKELKDEKLLCEVMNDMVHAHRNNIPVLAKGFNESRRYLPDSAITAFLDRAIRNRITLRLIAENHLYLSDATSHPTQSPRIGVLDLNLSPVALIHSSAKFVSSLCEATYGVSPPYRVELEGTETIGYISVHLEYILTEILKNAFRATVERHSAGKKVEEEEDDSDVFRFKDLPAAHLEKSDFPEIVISVGIIPGVCTIRVRDRGGGVPQADLPNVFSYAFTTVPRLSDPDEDPDSPESDNSHDDYYTGGRNSSNDGNDSSLKTELGTLAGLGFGLPLSRLYAGYFGGSLELVSLPGLGTDVYVCLRTV